MDQEPERLGNARWTFERFLHHAKHEVGAVYGKFMRPLVRALGPLSGSRRGFSLLGWRTLWTAHA